MVSDEIIKVINELCQKLGIAVDWSTENLLPQIQMIINKYTVYSIARNAMWGLFCAVVAVISFKAGLRMFNAIKTEQHWVIDKYGDLTIISIAYMIFISICFVVSAIVACVCIENLIKALIIPELYTIQKIMEEVKWTQ